MGRLRREGREGGGGTIIKVMHKLHPALRNRASARTHLPMDILVGGRGLHEGGGGGGTIIKMMHNLHPALRDRASARTHLPMDILVGGRGLHLQHQVNLGAGLEQPGQQLS